MNPHEFVGGQWACLGAGIAARDVELCRVCGNTRQASIHDPADHGACSRRRFGSGCVPFKEQE